MEVTFKGKSIEKMVKKLSMNMQNKRMLLNGIRIEAFKDVREHFTKSQGPEGQWKPRSESTIKSYLRSKDKKSWVNHKILIGSGTMSRGIFYRTKKDTVELVSNEPYSATHNYGRGKIPKREFMWLSDKGMQAMTNLVLNLIMKGT